MSRFRMVLMILVLMCSIIVSRSLWAVDAVVASQYSDRYHKPGCKIASKIPSADKVTYSTVEEATGAGLAPCKKCYPSQVTGNFNKKA